MNTYHRFSLAKLSNDFEEPNVELIFSEKLFKSIESLLNDSNDKVRLSAAIALLTILKKFNKPFKEQYENAFDCVS